jgi:beta-glucosidase
VNPQQWAASLVAEMTLAEKIGQMTQVDKGSITPAEVADHHIGSVLSGGGGNPSVNSPDAWRDMVHSYLEAGRDTRLGIPVVYGVDAVHGHSNVRGATIFPHNIGIGAACDVDLVTRIGRATAQEMAATGVRWTFAPTVAVPQDIRWGRTYEGYARDPAVVAQLGAGLVAGLRDASGGNTPVMACLKHYVGDGGTAWGSVTPPAWVDWWKEWGPQWRIDQGDVRVSEDVLRSRHLPPYLAGIDAGAETVMASYSSWNGEKLHGHHQLLTQVLKQELGFGGFVVTDWMGVDQLESSYAASVAQAINAGIDMVMVPFDFRRFIDVVTRAATDGLISMERIDDAVRRILAAKASSGLTDPSMVDPPLEVVGAAEHRALAAEAARRSVVLLADNGLLPLRPATEPLYLAGVAADDMGLQCGGWTIEWQGAVGGITEGTTFRQALATPGLDVRYAADGRFAGDEKLPIGIVCLAEEPYAEGVGDCAVPDVRAEDRVVFARMRERCERLVLVVYSGRPLVITDLIEASDAVVAAWLPGTEATELPGLLFGRWPFEGRLPQPWPHSADELGDPETSPRYAAGHALTIGGVNG